MRSIVPSLASSLLQAHSPNIDPKDRKKAEEVGPNGKEAALIISNCSAIIRSLQFPNESADCTEKRICLHLKMFLCRVISHNITRRTFVRHRDEVCLREIGTLYHKHCIITGLKFSLNSFCFARVFAFLMLCCCGLLLLSASLNLVLGGGIFSSCQTPEKKMASPKAILWEQLPTGVMLSLK